MRRTFLVWASAIFATGFFAQSVQAQDNGYTRKVVVEELTGTACGWCPRGLVGMKMLREQFGDRFIGIAIHQFNATDPMYTSEYEEIDWSGDGSNGAPCCMLDRSGDIIDPFYGSAGDAGDVVKDFQRALSESASVGVTVSGTWNDDYTAVTATADITSDVAGKYGLVYVLIADSVTGNTSRWRQLNNYCGYTRDTFDDDRLAPFLKDGQYGQQGDYCKYVFEDVLVASSYKNYGTQYSKDIRNLADSVEIVPGQTTTTEPFVLTLPTQSPLKGAVQKARIGVIAMVIDPQSGRVMNADKQYLDLAPTSVRPVSVAEQAEQARYNVSGQRITKPQKGLNLVRQADGTVRKEMVR